MDIIAIHASSRRHRPALVQGDRVLTWGEYAERRNRLAQSLLELGVEAGQRVVVWAPNAIEYLLAGAAASAVGAVSVPMNHRLTAEEATYILDDSDAVAVFLGDPFLAVAEEVR